MIKKIFCGLLVASTLFACSQKYDDWKEPQANPQAPVVTFGEDGKLEPVGLIDFATIANPDSMVQVCKVTLPSCSDTKYSPVLSLSMGDDVTMLTLDGYVKASFIKSYVETTYGKAPVEREINAQVSFAQDNGNMLVPVCVAPVLVKAKLTAPHIAENYYIIGGTLDWAESAASKAQKFSHSHQSVYDDPVFTIVIPASADGDTWFAIADDEACEGIVNGDWSKLYGTTSGNGKSGESGMLARRTELEDDGSFMVENGSKFIQVEINMMDATYKVSTMNFEPYLWVPGNAQGWNPGGAGRVVSENLDGIYEGYIYVDGGFKFTSAPNWDHTNYGAGETEGTLSDTGDNLDWGTGVYYVKVDLTSLTFEKTLVEHMSIIGDFNGWADDLELTWNPATSAYEGNVAAVTASGWKFRVNHGWDFNLGGDDLTNLWNNGPNLTATGEFISLHPLRIEGDNENIYATLAN